MSAEMAAIRRPIGLDELEPLLAAHAFDAAVLVQTCSRVEETRTLLAVAEAADSVAGVVGWVDLTSADVAETIAELRERADGRHLVGVRHQVHDEPDAEWLLREDVRCGLRALQDAGLAYDLLVRPRELPAALDTARAFPPPRPGAAHPPKPPRPAGGPR